MNLITLQKNFFRRDMIRKSAREEFELAREEKDPVLIMKMILTSR